MERISSLRHTWVLLLLFGSSDCSKATQPAEMVSASESTKVAAARATAENNLFCTAIQPFYWEIGSASSSLGSGSTGNGSVNATTALSIASASKLVFASYLLEKLNGSLSANAVKALNFTSGYSTFTSCLGYSTVASCYAGVTASVAGNIDKFYYGGGHMQKIAAVDLGLGALNATGLASELSNFLGSDIGISFSIPQPAGGVLITASGYAGFLRKILGGNLRMLQFLGLNSVCTNIAICPNAAVYTPIPSSESWSYSMGHWIENDATNGDGAFSSPGLYGFYPWISSDKSRYGILARYNTGTNAYWESVECGRLIRRAYAVGVAQ